MAYTVGTGSVVTFATSTSLAPLITQISHSGISRQPLQTSHLATSGYHTFIPSELVDGGEVTIDFWLDSATYSATQGLDTWPPISGAAETVAIIRGASSGAPKVSFSGFCTNWEYDIPLEDGVTGTMTFKVAGAITLSAT